MRTSTETASSIRKDLDQDGILDWPNFVDPTACDDLTAGSEHDRCVADNLLTWYEASPTPDPPTHLAAEAGCAYAVVLTDRLTGEGGKVIDSPFPPRKPEDQTCGSHARAVHAGPIRALHRQHTVCLVVHHSTVTADMEALRAGLYGEGVRQLRTVSSVSDSEPWTADAWLLWMAKRPTLPWPTTSSCPVLASATP